MTEENRVMGRFPMGQLAQTTEVENYAGFPSGKLKEFIDSAIDPSRQYMFPPVEEHPHAVTGPELMELMRQQATNFGTRVITDDIVSVDFSKPPLVLNSSENGTFKTHTVIIATGASANYLGLSSRGTMNVPDSSICLGISAYRLSSGSRSGRVPRMLTMNPRINSRHSGRRRIMPYGTDAAWALSRPI